MPAAPVASPPQQSNPANPAPRLLRSGIDVTQIDRHSLPPHLWSKIETIALSRRRESDRWELAVGLCQACHERLGLGQSPDQISEWLASGDVRQLLKSASAIRSAVIETGLPVTVLHRVNQARQRLGWWLPGRLRKEERIEGIVELCHRLEEELQQGQSTEQLASRSARTLARQVCQLELRKRWWISRALRALRLGLLWFTVLVVGTWCVLFCRMLLATNQAKTDLITRYDRLNAEVAESDRAWPLVRDSHISLIPHLNSSSYQIQMALQQGPAHAQWDQARDYLQRHRGEVAQLHQAALRAGMGHRYRDDADNLWYQAQGLQGWKQFFASGVTTLNTPLFHSNAYSNALAVLLGEYFLAREENDRDRAAHALIARLRLAALISKSPDFATIQSTGDYYASDTIQQISDLLELPDSQVSRELLEGFDRAILEFEDIQPEGNQSLDETLVTELGNLYSSGGNGMVSFTGLQVMRQAIQVESRLLPVARWLGDPRMRTTPPYTPPQDWTVIGGPIIAPFIIRHRAAEAKLRQLLTLEAADSNAAPGGSGARTLTEELDALAATDFSAIHNGPILAAMLIRRNLSAAGGRGPRMPTQIAERRANRLRIALEKHRLTTGKYPVSLEELIRVELPELPLDPYDNRPLKYRLVGGVPLIYSVGLDGKDQTANLQQIPEDKVEAHDADMQLSPHRRVSDRP